MDIRPRLENGAKVATQIFGWPCWGRMEKGKDFFGVGFMRGLDWRCGNYFLRVLDMFHEIFFHQFSLMFHDPFIFHSGFIAARHICFKKEAKPKRRKSREMG